MDTSDFITLRDAAALLGVDIRTVRRLAAAGHIQRHVVRRRLWCRRSQILAMMQNDPNPTGAA